MRLTRILVIAARRSALCSVRNFVSVDTVHCEENAHHSRLLRWRGEWGCGLGLGQLVGCWKGLPAGDAHKGALPVTGIRVASNTAHTNALPPPCLRMARWLRLSGPCPGQVPCGWPCACAPLPSAPLGLLGGELAPLVWAGDANRRPLVWGTRLVRLVGCN